VISRKYGLRENAVSSWDRKAILVAPGDGAGNSSSGRVLISAKESLGAFTITEFTSKPQSAREALNEAKDVAWYVINGELSFEIGDKKFVAPEGGFVLLPRGTRHRVWASGKATTKFLLIRSPG
jgi:mannose-6-phosphate isomerase-like protein (cupin superfamily)